MINATAIIPKNPKAMLMTRATTSRKSVVPNPASPDKVSTVWPVAPPKAVSELMGVWAKET